eukprot:GHRR01005840.1.p1 GENE.GHRR01005840.1~~GHRR01005840.1.p1  ORF type:complete len:253 (+),score=64.60 GHRR01005840.1:382-1140(+)
MVTVAMQSPRCMQCLAPASRRLSLCRSRLAVHHGSPKLPCPAAYSGEAEQPQQVTLTDSDAMSAETPATSLNDVTTQPTTPEVSSHPLPDLFGAQELFSELQDKNQFGKRGEVWLFAQIAVIVLVLLPPFQLTGLVDIAATLLITAGLVFICYALLSLGRYFSPLPAPRAKHELVISGMYSYVRHPMYGGLIMSAFGLAIITHNETRLAMAVLLWLVLEKKVSLEEQMLTERYGKAYTDYKAKVKQFFPFVY